MRVTTQAGHAPARQPSDLNTWQSAIADICLPILICLLDTIFFLKLGYPVGVFNGGKAGALLCLLALQSEYFLARDALLSILWPQTNPTLATQSLNSLVYSLHKLLGDAIGGSTPVVHRTAATRPTPRPALASTGQVSMRWRTLAINRIVWATRRRAL